MPSGARSYGGSMETTTLQKYQIGTDVMIFLPDPTFGAGGATTWDYEIVEVSTLTVKATGTINWPAEGNFIKVNLASSLYSTGEIYRVRTFDSTMLLKDEWHFSVFSNNFGTVGPANTATINEYIERIAGLLGLYAKIEHTAIDKGIPTTTVISIYDKDPSDPTAVLQYQYTQKKFVDETHRVIGEVSARDQ